MPYAHLGTGNYHPATTKLYTDFGMLTARADICEDVEKVFMHLTSLTKVEKLKELYELFAETLDELCRMGSAYSADPGVRV